MTRPKILITGMNGQVGYELVRSMQGLGDIVGLDRVMMDLENADSIRDTVRRVQPALIVNPAAYTAVDKAETESALAHRINAVAPGILAEEAARLHIPLIHFSTDYVYDGKKVGLYFEDDAATPGNVYGQSKLAGEQAVLAAGCSHLIFRTSWVYGSRGGNFVKTMMRLGTDREVLKVVGDQHGAPTWSRTIADITAHIVAKGATHTNENHFPREWWEQRSGVYHLTARGETTWAQFAEEIFSLKKINCRVEAIPTSEYPTPASRPSNSRVSNSKLEQAFGVSSPDWRHALSLCLETM